MPDSDGVGAARQRQDTPVRNKASVPGPAAVTTPADEPHFRAMLESHPSSVILVDDSGRISWANEQTGQLLGYSTQELIGRLIDDLVPERFRAEHPTDRAAYLAHPNTRQMGLGRDLSARHKDGHLVPVEIGLSSFTHGGARFVVAVVASIEARKADETAILSTLGNLQALIEASPLATLSLDLDGRVLMWNPACERMFGWKAGEVLGRVLPHVPPSELPEIREVLRSVSDGKVISGMELLRRRKDGGSVEVELYAAPQRDTQGKVTAVIEQLADITGRKHLQQSLLQAQKMESIGRLAGGIAHDFNNMLTAISGFAQLLTMDLPPGTREFKNAETIIHASRQATALTQQLLAYSRQQVMQPQIVDPDRSIRDMEPMLRNLIGADVEIRVDLHGATGNIRVDPAQLEQVVLNLVVNARDAMPDGGRIGIETGRATFDAAYASEHFSVLPGDYAMVAVSDSGVGMDTATRAHIFEPFFTTKGLGKGTGLGLATVYGIVRQSGGHIWLYSEPGEGTTFKVYFPIVGVPATESLPVLSAVTRGGSETILLVEDERVVREFARAVLERLGYRVLVAASPRDALAIIEGNGEPIQLLVSDIVMPVLSGTELARQIRTLRPNVKTLFLSGYTEQVADAGGRLTGMDGFLSKPFAAEDLARKVSDILDASRVSLG